VPQPAAFLFGAGPCGHASLRQRAAFALRHDCLFRARPPGDLSAPPLHCSSIRLRVRPSSLAVSPNARDLPRCATISSRARTPKQRRTSRHHHPAAAAPVSASHTPRIPTPASVEGAAHSPAHATACRLCSDLRAPPPTELPELNHPRGAASAPLSRTSRHPGVRASSSLTAQRRTGGAGAAQ